MAISMSSRIECPRIREAAMRRTGAARAAAFAVAAVLSIGLSPTARAEAQNDAIGFSPNHYFTGSPDGENINILNGNMSLAVPVGPRFQLSSDFSYGITLYYNSKVWHHECKNLPPTEPCWGTVDVPENYGVGWTLHFGRVWRDADDHSNIYKYQTPDGADHFFCKPGTGGTNTCTYTERTIDGSGITVQKVGSNWVAYPGDGTKVILNHCASVETGVYGGCYATRVESVTNPSVGFNIAYMSATDHTIDSITDSSGRTIDIARVGGSYGNIEIAMPQFGGGTSVYRLVRTSKTIYDPSCTIGTSCSHFDSVPVATQLDFPALTPGTESYKFCYDRSDCPGQYGPASGELPFGYMLGRILPTGASYTYWYGHYSTSINRPRHSMVQVKELQLEPSGPYHRWSYTRFSNTPISGNGSAGSGGVGYSGSNPFRVLVLDPMSNVCPPSRNACRWNAVNR